MKIGVIGIGYWGKKVLGEYLALEKEKKIESVGICDANQSILKMYAGKVAMVSDNYKEFISSSEIDAVHICTNNATHYEIAKAAIEAGKHVLLEKPMTINANQAYNLVEMASHQGVALQVGHIFRFANVIRKTRELIETGYFGDIHYFTLRWTNLMNPIKDVDVLWDLLPHPIDILNFVTGEFPVKIGGIAGAYRRAEPNEIAFINMIFEKGFIAHIELSWLSPKRERIMRIIGSKRSAEIECVQQKMYIYEGNDNFFEMPIEDNNTIKEEQENFFEAIKSGRTMFNSHIVGARTVDIIEKTIQAVK